MVFNKYEGIPRDPSSVTHMKDESTLRQDFLKVCGTIRNLEIYSFNTVLKN